MKSQIKNSTIQKFKPKDSLRAGFSMFIAVVIMSALALIAFSVVNISVKESSFATSNKESQYAIFAADAGVECALYWDAKFSPSKFATTTSGSPISCANGSSLITPGQIANGDAIPGTTTVTMIGGGGLANPKSTFYFRMNNGVNPVNACAVVEVTVNDNGTTYVSSKGYNNCNPNDPKRVERGIEVTY